MRVYPRLLYRKPEPVPEPEPYQEEEEEEEPVDDSCYFLMIFIFSVFGLAILDSLE